LASTKRRLRKQKTARLFERPRPRRVEPKIPDDVRILTLHGVEYFIQWERFDVGCSFFLPTTATPVQVREALRYAMKLFVMRVEIRSRCEYGRYGARIWRVY
jgi:hypothetical protein